MPDRADIADRADLARRLRAAGLHPVDDMAVGSLTTYRVGGSAAIGIEVDSVGEILTVAEVITERCRAAGDAKVAILVVGKGSNLLVSDRGVDGVAIRLGSAFEQIEMLEWREPGEGGSRAHVRFGLRAGGAASLPVVARRAVAEGLTGFEWAVGVPGSMGGAVRMNAGGHGSDMAASVREVRVLDLTTGQDRVMTRDDCCFGYRHSAIAADEVVLHVDLELALGSRELGEAEISEIVGWRRHHQPGGQNAGSVFANPLGDSAGRLIDIAGCKGLRIGTAEVSMKHANFIQADPGGRADDVASVMAEVRRRVHRHSGADLRAETVMVGFEPSVIAAAGGR